MRARLPSLVTHRWSPDAAQAFDEHDAPTGRYPVATRANAIASSIWDEEEMPTRPDMQGLCARLASDDAEDSALDRLTLPGDLA